MACLVLLAACESSGSGGDAVADVPDAATDTVADAADAGMDALLDANIDRRPDVPTEPIVVTFDGWVPDAYFIDFPPVDANVVTDHPRCPPATPVECICLDSRVGFQICDDDAGAWNWCNCEGAPPPAPPLPPRLIAPLSGLRVTSQRPTLRWELPTGVTRARVEVCEDRACSRTLTSAEVTGNSWRSATPLRPGVVFWRVLGLRADGTTAWTSATWEFGVRHRDTPTDTAWGSLKDFDGDGYDDLVVRVGTGQPHPYTPTGQLVYRGRPEGLELVPASQITGRSGDRVIPCVETVVTGDINSDGLADLVTDCAGISSFMGTRSGRVLQPADVLPVGVGARYVYTLADMDGDGDMDLVSPFGGSDDSGPFLNEEGRFDPHHGGTYHLRVGDDAPAGPSIGMDIASVGDVDGDGYAEVALLSANLGVMYGSPATALGTRQSLINGISGGARRSGSGAVGVDLNADGRGDLYAAFTRREFHSFLGRLVRVRIDEREPDMFVIFRTYRDMETYYQTLSRPGDVDGDGRAEVAVSTQRCTALAQGCTRSRVDLYRSDENGFSSPPSWTLPSEDPIVAGIPGDLNGDGYDDLVIAIGPPGGTLGVGDRLRILYGSARGPTPGPEIMLPSTEQAILSGPQPLY